MDNKKVKIFLNSKNASAQGLYDLESKSNSF